MTNNSLLLKASFLRNPSQNGVGRYVCQLQRVVLKFCKNHGASRGLREFIEEDLVDFAKTNPGVVVYLKPRRHRGPVIKAEYLNGQTQWLSCRNFTKDEINKWLNLFKTQQGDKEGIRLRKLWHTEVPSIQGPWTPYTFRPPSLNVVEYPNENLSAAKEEKSATEELIELFEKQKLESLKLEKTGE
ncbi:39S ribosomal protein L43, mitochondrial [Coccinella septempunctata]|uniref:39S ribosomal protein L43, mitochondrial n=1 Tax=Coccinella septempunctata TaxID=41139 RepID=UPI001D085E61|nr:39S ribosomal protein L43, mitochondrial [Coccinella septempunctata]